MIPDPSFLVLTIRTAASPSPSPFPTADKPHAGKGPYTVLRLMIKCDQKKTALRRVKHVKGLVFFGSCRVGAGARTAVRTGRRLAAWRRAARWPAARPFGVPCRVSTAGGRGGGCIHCSRQRARWERKFCARIVKWVCHSPEADLLEEVL